ncbi:MAG TPA: hypothetical protein VMT03_23900 [Polyangia bacterium]|nr:hypothetical protein [Polyangia bacterium]
MLIAFVPMSLAAIAIWRPAISVPVVIFAGQMFLPPVIGFVIPALPPFDKEIIPSLSALIGCLIFRPGVFRGARPGKGIDKFLILMIVGFLGSWLTNRDALVFPRGVVPGLTVFTFIGGTIAMLLTWGPPIFLGRTVIRSSQDLLTLVKIVVGSAVIYTIPMMVEMRLSPMLNVWVYGFMQHQFVQEVRGGHYRPMVFMGHGLSVAFFTSFAILGAVGLARIRAQVFGIGARKVALFLVVILVACHSLGALLYVVCFAPLIVLANTRIQTQIARWTSMFVLTYPLLRAVGLIPVPAINAFVQDNFGAERAGSLGLRLSEEEYILNRTLERPVFGWGIGSRAFRLDPITGENTSTTDGAWAIEFGHRGIVGFIATFGLAVYPIWKSRRALRRLSKPDQVLIGSMCLMGAIYLVDQIPNATYDPYATFVLAVLSRVVTNGLEDDSLGAATPFVTGSSPNGNPAVSGES